jgi:hypothetical protein
LEATSPFLLFNFQQPLARLDILKKLERSEQTLIVLRR